MSEHVCRRLFLFLDGTWNEDTEERPATNIVYLRELLFRGLNVRLRRAIDDKNAQTPNPDNDLYDQLPESFRKKGISGLVFDGYEYIVYYDKGVGTGFMDRIKGGVTGVGLDKNIREAYRFLSNWYRPGDEIYVFGFSRGAYTARSLCGYVQAIGLLRREACTPENEDRAWRFYRTAPGNRLSGEWSWFNELHEGKTAALVHDNRFARIRALCVFDTVGALGIPAGFLRRLNQAKYSFHDTDVNSLVDIRLHALAIDEPRRTFKPTIWTKPKFKLVDPDKSPTAQVWFAGAHSDVGGGYVNWAAHRTGLSLVPLAWMIQKLNHYVVKTPPTADAVPAGLAVPPKPQAPIPFYTDDLLDGGRIKTEIQNLVLETQHKPWAVLYAILGIANRRVLNQLTPGTRTVESSGRVAFADPFCELVHVSALERLGEKVEIDQGTFLNLFGKQRTYGPRNLKDIVPYLAATYVRNEKVAPNSPWRHIVKPIVTWKQPYIVDWDGTPLDPEKDSQAERAFDLLPDPDAVGVTSMPKEMKYILEKRNGLVAST
jgi:uncharacterized protein (DUF2235 family)